MSQAKKKANLINAEELQNFIDSWLSSLQEIKIISATHIGTRFRMIEAPIKKTTAGIARIVERVITYKNKTLNKLEQLRKKQPRKRKEKILQTTEIIPQKKMQIEIIPEKKMQIEIIPEKKMQKGTKKGILVWRDGLTTDERKRVVLNTMKNWKNLPPAKRMKKAWAEYTKKYKY